MLKEKVLSTIYRNELIKENSKLLIGVSGGPDSLVLLHILKEIQPLFHYEMIVASVDHMFRGEESFGDYKYVEHICERWGIAFEEKGSMFLPGWNRRGKFTNNLKKAAFCFL